MLTILLCIGIGGALWNVSRLSSEPFEKLDRIEGLDDLRVTHDYTIEQDAIPVPATFILFPRRLKSFNVRSSCELVILGSYIG
ncbi:MAG: hypothetical protein SWY16_06830 [Cyanobacteriota bacterium]|nr:hypothetical protein [Cyanobacteriota bacterium]